jgi:hypothetical protein
MIGHVAQLTLADFDGRLMDGLLFCRKVYKFFEQISTETNGVRRLRLRDRVTKKLVEELLPLTHYIRHWYGEGRRLKVRWVSGTQSYDAILLCNGWYVTEGNAKPRQYVEITSVVHPNDAWRRHLLATEGGSFGPRGIKRDPVTKMLTSEPYLNRHEELGAELLSGVLGILRRKNTMSYPEDTALVIQVHGSGRLVQEDHWQTIIGGLRAAEIDHQFFEVFLYEPVGRHVSSIFPSRRD